MHCHKVDDSPPKYQCTQSANITLFHSSILYISERISKFYILSKSCHLCLIFAHSCSKRWNNGLKYSIMLFSKSQQSVRFEKKNPFCQQNHAKRTFDICTFEAYLIVSENFIPIICSCQNAKLFPLRLQWSTFILGLIYSIKSGCVFLSFI